MVFCRVSVKAKSVALNVECGATCEADRWRGGMTHRFNKPDYNLCLCHCVSVCVSLCAQISIWRGKADTGGVEGR